MTDPLTRLSNRHADPEADEPFRFAWDPPEPEEDAYAEVRERGQG